MDSERIDNIANRVGGGRALAGLVGVHETTVSRWRSGSHPPTKGMVKTLTALEKLLARTSEQVLGRVRQRL